MFDTLKEHLITVQEEINYYDKIFRHKKSLESTLWGIEEQSRLPDNTTPENQIAISEQMNNYRKQIADANMILDSQKNKIKKYINNFSL